MGGHNSRIHPHLARASLKSQTLVVTSICAQPRLHRTPPPPRCRLLVIGKFLVSSKSVWDGQNAVLEKNRESLPGASTVRELSLWARILEVRRTESELLPRLEDVDEWSDACKKDTSKDPLQFLTMLLVDPMAKTAIGWGEMAALGLVSPLLMSEQQLLLYSEVQVLP